MSALAIRLSDLVSLLTSFSGRIGRRSWWIGVVIISAGNLIGTLLFNPDPLATYGLRAVHLPSWPETIWRLVWLVPATAITVKRFNDRNWPSWLGYTFAPFWTVVELLEHFGLLVNPDTRTTFVFFVMMTYSAFVVIDNGFFRGTVGPNRYGPDPLIRSSPPL